MNDRTAAQAARPHEPIDELTAPRLTRVAQFYARGGRELMVRKDGSMWALPRRDAHGRFAVSRS